jgi:hypothetical protein
MSVPDHLLDPPEPRHCPVCEGCEGCEESAECCVHEHVRCVAHDNADYPEGDDD